MDEMDSIFSITTATDSIPIGTQRSATVTFTVTNRSAQPLTGRAVLVMDPPNDAHSDWLKLPPPQKSERHFDPSTVENYVVEVDVPVEAPAGEYIFHLDMEDTADPDETYTVGPTVKLQVAAPEKKKKPFPWWIIAVAVAVLVVIIGAIILLTRHSPAPTPTPTPTSVFKSGWLTYGQTNPDGTVSIILLHPGQDAIKLVDGVKAAHVLDFTPQNGGIYALLVVPQEGGRQTVWLVHQDGSQIGTPIDQGWPESDQQLHIEADWTPTGAFLVIEAIDKNTNADSYIYVNDQGAIVSRPAFP